MHLPLIELDETFLFKILRPKKSSFVSGNRPGENFSMTHPRIVKCVSEYIFSISKKKTKEQKENKNTKKTKEIKEEKRISPENQLKK